MLNKKTVLIVLSKIMKTDRNQLNN